MNDTLVVDREAIHLRRHATKLMQEAHENGYQTIDVSNVEFVSRSVADELVHLSGKFDIQLNGLRGEVASMIDIVSEQIAAV